MIIASVIDKGIATGKTNWQLYGSRKPGNEAYEVVQHWNMKYDAEDDEFRIYRYDGSGQVVDDFITVSSGNI